MSDFGIFQDGGSEYCINNTMTPRAQLNYMWNDRFLSGVNHFGGGTGSYGNRAATYIDPEGKGRCSIIKDGNRYFYIRDMDSGEFWNIGWYPSKNDLDEYSCVHGLGYSIINSSKNMIETKARVFCNLADPAEIWTIKIKNRDNIDRRINMYSFAEFALTGYPVYCNYYATVYSKYDKENNLILAVNNAQERPHEWYNAFMASSCEITGFETSYTAFFKNYTDINAPYAVKEGKCSDSLACGEDMAGVLENSFLIKPGEEIECHILIGATGSAGEEAEMVRKLFKPGQIDSDFNLLKKSKEEMTNSIVINTPDEKLNNIINKWTKQQIQLCSEVGRDVGKGFRDQLQDAWGVTSFNSELAKEKIIETLRYQNSDGSCVRAWLPIDPHIYSDGPTWIAPCVNAYIKETGDFEILNIKVPYLDSGESTVWEHILIAARYSSEDTGRNGLVLARDGDWNDSLNGMGKGGKGESVWTSIALFEALKNTAEIADKVYGDIDIAAEMKDRSDKIKDCVNKSGWDGKWYLAGYTDDGDKVGSENESEGSIYLNSQTWAILTGIADNEKIEKCVDSVDEMLMSKYGPLTLYPTYTKYNPAIGRLTGFVPGIWENGTPYCHGGAFKIISDCTIGRGNEAYRTIKSILPDSDLNPSDYSGCEPYVLTNMYFGPDNPQAGKTMFAWVTGTAGWIFRAATQYIMGFHPSYDEILINPCIPSDWKQCSMKRNFRGDVYNLKILNPNNSQSGISKIIVDGKEIEGNKIAIFYDGKEHIIEVTMK